MKPDLFGPLVSIKQKPILPTRFFFPPPAFIAPSRTDTPHETLSALFDFPGF